jgi:nucleoid-associated protein YgaU
MSERDRAYDPDDERLDTDFESFDEQRQRSRMARELKIGLAVIFVLVVVLGVVLYNRLSPAKESEAASSEAPSESPDETPEDDPAAAEPEVSPGTWNPTIVPAIAGSEAPSQAAPLPSLDPGNALVGDGQVSEDSLESTTPLSLPSLAPKLMSVELGDRYAGYGGAEQAGAAPAAGQGERSAGVDPRQGVQTAEARPGSALASGPEDAQPPASSVSDPGFTRLPGNQVNVAPPAGAAEVSQSDAASTPEPNPLRTLSSPLEPIEQQAVTSSPDAATRLVQPSEAFRGDASQAPTSVAEVNPSSRYGEATAQPWDTTQQAHVSGSRSPQTSSLRAQQSDTTSVAGPSSQQWAPGANAALGDPVRPSLPSRDPNPGVTGQRDLAASASRPKGTYLVQPNDNYWRISEKVYGTASYFKALAHHNRAKIANDLELQPGDVVMVPDASELYEAYPDLCPKPANLEAARRRALAAGRPAPLGAGRVYVVQEGDNLFDIARYELGKPTRWTEIVDLNREVLGPNLQDLNYLIPGMKLILPQNQPAGELSRRPGSLYQR